MIPTHAAKFVKIHGQHITLFNFVIGAIHLYKFLNVIRDNK